MRMPSICSDVTGELAVATKDSMGGSTRFRSWAISAAMRTYWKACLFLGLKWKGYLVGWED